MRGSIRTRTLNDGSRRYDCRYRTPEGDHRTRAILEKMKEDEERHGDTASRAGGAELPEPVRRLMALASKVMTTTAYRI